MEGSLDAPTRHAIPWRDEAFYDEPALEAVQSTSKSVRPRSPLPPGRRFRTSVVYFIHFDFTPGQVEHWRAGEGSAMLVIDHPNHGHAALIGPETRAFLAREGFA